VYRFGVLGPLRLASHGHNVAPTAPKQRQLLALLLLNANRVVPMSTVLEELWGPVPPRTATAAVHAYITHGVLSGGAVARIAGSRMSELVFTDSIQATEAVRLAHNIRVLSIAPLIGEAIGRTAKEESVSSLFD
jgi:hypothetical protein